MKKILIFILIFSLFCLTGCESKKTDEELQKEKSLSELEFAETTALSMVEKYLTKKYFEDDKINWNNVEEDFRKISSSSSGIILDLTNLKFENNKILEFESNVNSLNTSITNKDENSFLENLKNFYKLMPNYVQKIYPENQSLYLEKKAKSYLLEAMYYCMVDDFETSINLEQKAEESYQNLMNSENYLDSYNFNRIYVKVQEMKICIQNHDKENAIQKYINTL